MENLNNYSIDFLEDLFRNSYNYDNKKTIKNPFQFETSSPISPFVKRWKRVRTIERRLLIAFQTKRKELLFRFSVSYVNVNIHISYAPYASFSHFISTRPIYLLIDQALLSLSLHIFILFPHFVHESISVDMTQGMKSFVPHPKKEKSWGNNIDIDANQTARLRCLVMPCRLNMWCKKKRKISLKNYFLGGEQFLVALSFKIRRIFVDTIIDFVGRYCIL